MKRVIEHNQNIYLGNFMLKTFSKCWKTLLFGFGQVAGYMNIVAKWVLQNLSLLAVRCCWPINSSSDIADQMILQSDKPGTFLTVR